MARVTGSKMQFEVPTSGDPANLALWTQRLAEQAEVPFQTYEWWSDFLNNQTSSGDTRAATPGIIRQLSANQTNFLTSTEKAIEWNSTVFDNMATNQPTGDLILPDQDQRYWWWVGACLVLPPITGNARMTTRLYVQDRDPATGLLAQSTYRYNQYMISDGEQYMLWDTFIRTGGGRQRMTFSHSDPAAMTVNALSMVWAIRICPDR